MFREIKLEVNMLFDSVKSRSQSTSYAAVADIIMLKLE